MADDGAIEAHTLPRATPFPAEARSLARSSSMLVPPRGFGPPLDWVWASSLYLLEYDGLLVLTERFGLSLSAFSTLSLCQLEYVSVLVRGVGIAPTLAGFKAACVSMRQPR